MTQLLIHDLRMTDTEYAALLAKGYEPVLEHQIIAIGEDLLASEKPYVRWRDCYKTNRQKLMKNGMNLWKLGQS